MSLIESSLLLAGNVDARTGFFFVSSSGSPKIHQLSCTGEIIVMSIYQGQPVETTYQDLDQEELSIQADANTEIAIVGNVTEISDIDVLTSIDLRACRSLQSLSISSEELDRINLAGCRQLETLNLAGCTGLTVLDLSQNVLLQSIDLSGCTGLLKLDVTMLSELQSIDVSGCTSLLYLDLTKTKKLSSLNIDGTQLESPNNTLILASLLGGGGGVPEGVAMEATSQEILQKVSTITSISGDINYGKEQLAVQISNKGVITSPNDSLVEMANKVHLISQSPITVIVDEEYERQITSDGALWNLYTVRACLSGVQEFKNNYPCFILAEYFLGYDSIALQNANAYITSDNAELYEDEDGWHIRISQIEYGGTHIWKDDYKYGNRWVCYLMGVIEQDFTCPNKDLCPRSIYISGHIGTLDYSIGNRLYEIVCPDEVSDGEQLNTVNKFIGGTQIWQRNVVINNVKDLPKLVSENIVTFTTNTSGNVSGLVSSSVLTSVSAPNIVSVSGSKILIEGATQINMPELQSVTYSSIVKSPTLRYIYLPKLMSVVMGNSSQSLAPCFSGSAIEQLILPELISLSTAFSGFISAPNMFRIYMPKYSSSLADSTWKVFPNCTSVEEFVIGHPTSMNVLSSMTKLIHLELAGDGVLLDNSLSLGSWEPTEALKIDSSSLVKEGETFANNLEKLLYNIKHYIADRVADRTGKSTLTMSFHARVKAVIDAQVSQEIVNAFISKNWTIA